MQGRCSKDPNQRSVTVTITDVCPECETDHIDMQALTFNKVLTRSMSPADCCACAGLHAVLCLTLRAAREASRGTKVAASADGQLRGGLQIAPMEGGRINIQYRRVECTPPEPLKVNIHANVGVGGWLRIAVEVLPANKRPLQLAHVYEASCIIALDRFN